MSENLKHRYSQVDLGEAESKETNLFAPRSSWSGAQFQMGVFLLAGVVLMLAHHCFYSYLDNKSADMLFFAVDGFALSDQSVVSGVGNTIAYAARAVLSAGIGVVFIQVFWSMLRRRQYSVHQIDALFACKGQPFDWEALPTWRDAFLLAVIASMASLMACISIFTPGSLRVETRDFSYPARCTVPTVSLETANISVITTFPNGSIDSAANQPRVLKLAARVLMSGAALPPKNPCQFPCRYNISFNAPTAECSPVNSDFDYASWLPPPDNDTAPIQVWNVWHSTYGANLVVAMRDFEMNSQSAVNCTMYNSTYKALVTFNNTAPPTVDVYETEPHGLSYTGNSSYSTLSYVDIQYATLTSSFANILYGTVRVDPGEGSIFDDDNLLVGYSPAFSGTSVLSWAPTSDLGTEISSLMQNLSVSLLTDQLSQEGNSTTAPYITTCWYSISTYGYQRMQLLATYGAAIVVAAICLLGGVWAVRQNGVEENLSFSRIAGAILNDSLFDGRYELTKASKLTAGGSLNGQLRLVDSDTAHG